MAAVEKSPIFPKKQRSLADKIGIFFTVLVGLAFLIDILLFDFNYFGYVLVLAFVGYYTNSFVESRLGRMSWEEVARDLRLEIYPKKPSLLGKPVIRGNHQGFEVVMETIRRDQGDYTQISIKLPFELPDTSFSIKRRGLLPDGIETKVDDEEMDKAFSIITSHPDLVKRLMKEPEIRQGLLELIDRSKSMHVFLRNSKLNYYELNWTIDKEYLAALYGYLFMLAEFLYPTKN